MVMHDSFLGLLLPALATVATAQAPAASDPLAWWRDARLGVSIHWGLYAIPAGRWNGDPRHAEDIRDTARIPRDEYAALCLRFDPPRFDAPRWAADIASAGAGYVVFTTKYRDGFCLFDAPASDFDVVASPLGVDVARELAAACRFAGLRIGWQHSIQDWHHPDYLPRREWEPAAPDADFRHYADALAARLRTLLTGYGDVAGVWLEGAESTWSAARHQALLATLREQAPGLVVGGPGGDIAVFHGEPPAGDPLPPAWERHLTIGAHRGYSAEDRSLLPAEALIQALAATAARGGNLVVNVAPMADGTFTTRTVDRLRAIGAWLGSHGDAIRGTEAGPFAGLPWGWCTQRTLERGTRLYLLVYRWPADGVIVVPGITNAPVSARVFGSDARPDVQRAGADLHVRVPAQAPDPACAVVELDVAGNPEVFAAPAFRADADTIVKLLDVAIDTVHPELAIHYTTDGKAPRVDSPRYTTPIRLTGPCEVRAQSFRDGEPVSTVAVMDVKRARTQAPIVLFGARFLPGLRCDVFEGRWDRLPELHRLTPVRREHVERIALPDPAERGVARRFDGFVDVPETAAYRFVLRADDFARVAIDRQPVARCDGEPVGSGVIALDAGRHSITVEWCNADGHGELDLRMAPLGSEPEPLPSSALFRQQ